MKKDEFASINTTKKRGNTVVIIVAVAAVCLAGVLCAWKLQSEGSKVLLETGSVSAEQYSPDKSAGRAGAPSISSVTFPFFSA